MVASIFTPGNYTYGGFTSQPATNIFNGVNPYYINNNNTYTPTPFVYPQPTQPTTPVVNTNTSSDGDSTYTTPASQFTGFGFGNNTGYNGPYNQGNPLSDLQPSYSFGNFLNGFDPVQTMIGLGATALTGSPLLGFGASQVYNNWDKLSFANPLAEDQKETFSTTTAETYKPATVTGTTNGINNYDSTDPGAVNADGSINWAGVGNVDYITIDGVGVSNPNNSSSSSSSSSSGSSSGGGYSGDDAGDAAAAAAGEESSSGGWGGGYSDNATGGF